MLFTAFLFCMFNKWSCGIFWELQEERGKRLEEMFDSDLDNSADNRYAPKEVVPEEGSVGVPGKKTQESLTAADVIIDALDTAEEEIKRINQYKVQVA